MEHSTTYTKLLFEVDVRLTYQDQSYVEHSTIYTNLLFDLDVRIA